MSKAITLMAVVAAVAATSGCSSLSRSIGAAKVAPDEFRVVTAAPLTLPPDYSLRPPRPGEPRPQEMDPDSEAHAAIFGADVAQNASVGERALVSQAGAEAIDPTVRDQVDFEAQNIVHRSDAFANRVIGFHGSADASHPLDGDAEQQRLREQEDIRRATGGGQVVIQRNAPGGFKLPGT